MLRYAVSDVEITLVKMIVYNELRVLSANIRSVGLNKAMKTHEIVSWVGIREFPTATHASSWN
jgi:hypothetical protein